MYGIKCAQVFHHSIYTRYYGKGSSVWKIENLAYEIQCNLDYPDLAYPAPQFSGLSPAQQMYMCACIEGMALVGVAKAERRRWAHFDGGSKLLEMTKEDAFMNPFGGLLEVKMPFHTKAYWEK